MSTVQSCCKTGWQKWILGRGKREVWKIRETLLCRLTPNRWWANPARNRNTGHPGQGATLPSSPYVHLICYKLPLSYSGFFFFFDLLFDSGPEDIRRMELQLGNNSEKVTPITFLGAPSPHPINIKILFFYKALYH